MYCRELLGIGVSGVKLPVTFLGGKLPVTYPAHTTLVRVRKLDEAVGPI